MKTFNSSMFDSIKGALQKQDTSGGGDFQNLLRMKTGNTYIVRLLPYVKAPEKSFFKYFNVGWESLSTGQYVQYVSPSTFEERDPILEARYKLYKSNDPDEKARATIIKRAERHLVSCYVVKDPTNEENNGTVKILGYGKQMDSIIRNAIEGDDADEFGERVFDLGPDGVNFKIKCEAQGEYPSYTMSRFTGPTDLNLSDNEIENIYNSAFDLFSFFPMKSQAELEKMYEEHFLCTNSEGNNSSDGESNDKPKRAEQRNNNASGRKPVSSSTTLDDHDQAQVSALLAGLDD